MYESTWTCTPAVEGSSILTELFMLFEESDMYVNGMFYNYRIRQWLRKERHRQSNYFISHMGWSIFWNFSMKWQWPLTFLPHQTWTNGKFSVLSMQCVKQQPKQPLDIVQIFLFNGEITRHVIMMNTSMWAVGLIWYTVTISTCSGRIYWPSQRILHRSTYLEG